MVGLADPPAWLDLEKPKGVGRRATRPPAEELGLKPDLSRLPRKFRDLISRGNRGEYPSRSEADMAVCVAMFARGYGLSEVWMAMTDPSNLISEKYFEKGPHGEAYLGLTASKARELVRASEKRRGLTYARRRGDVSLG